MSAPLVPSLNSLPVPIESSGHFTSVKNKIPDWLINASPDVHGALRRAGGKRLPWFEQAWRSMPHVVQALQQDWLLHQSNEQKLHALQAEFPALEAFAEPLLVEAIKQRFNLQLDVRKTWLFQASRVHVDDSFAAASRDPLVELEKSLKAATQTLLHAALQNFEEWETVSGALDLGERQKAAVYDRYPVVGVGVTGTALEIAPHAFATLCRELDLGGKYQQRVDAFLNPPSNAGDAADAATFNRRGLFKRVEQSAFAVQVHLAYMKRDISESLYTVLLDVARNGTDSKLDGQPVTCGLLRLWEIDLTGIVAIGKAREASDSVQRVVVYIPDDPVCPLKEYESSAAFTRALRDRMLIDGYLDFFQRFVPARHRAELFARLDQCLRPRVWNKDMGWYEQQVDPQARLHLRERPLATGLLTAITEQKASVLRDDALFHAVPTADENQKTAAERIHYFASLAMQALNLLGFVVPQVGAVMMAVTAAQLTTEVFEGIDSWTRGEWEQGWGYLMDVVENMALMAALGAAHQRGATPALEKISVETPSFIEALEEVELPDGKTRLWKPDVAPFAQDTVLPEGLKPDEFGLYHYQEKTWISVEGQVYSVRQTPSDGQFRMQHPTDALSYQPALRHNGAGAWLHPVDQPLEWEGLKLFRRLGHTVAEFSDVAARRILQVSDTREAVLRKMLVENQRPPALLDDTLQRFGLDQQIQRNPQPGATAAGNAALFDARYRAASHIQQPGGMTITRSYPGLPTVVVDELVRQASPAQLAKLVQGRVPLPVAEEIRVYQQQVRLARAYEGLFLDSVNNPDTDLLILHSLERLAGWPSTLRLEVREGWFQGALIDALGPADAAVRKTLVKYPDGYETLDEQGVGLHGRDDIYASVLHALPDASRIVLGFPGTWDGPKLKRAVQDGPLLPRQTLRTVLKMQPPAPGQKSPMRLADGRAGYPLSGRGAMQGFIARETLLDMIRHVGVARADMSPEQILTTLEGAGMDRQQIHQRLIQVLDERMALDHSMNAWGDDSEAMIDLNLRLPSRNGIHDAIWRHWSENTLPEMTPTLSPLRLQNIVLSDFPQALPDFFLQRVSGLELVDVSISRSSTTTPAPISQAVEDRLALGEFFTQFPHITSLEINRTALSTAVVEPLVFQLPYLVAHSFPALRTLRLINQRIWISALEVQSLSTLEHLQWLDLSGNEASFITPANLINLRVRYLGLDSIGLDAWPSWLDGLPSAQIEELSLRHNRITEIPWDILVNPPTAHPATRVSLQGNPLSRVALIRMRLNQRPDSRFHFDLDIAPSLQAQIDLLRQERTQLQEAIDSWAQASSSSRPLSEATVEVRRLIGQTLIDYWRAYSEGQTYAVLMLERISLDDFPRQLPAFFYLRVRGLQLAHVRADTAQLNRLLANFRQLTSLEIVGRTQPMPDLPSALTELPGLTSLGLTDQGCNIDQQAMDFFARLRHLETLDLTGNRLMAITDVSAMPGTLRWLCLNSTGLDHWPQWVEGLMPLEGLMLDNNQLTELPEHILHNPRNDHAQTEIAVRGNPLTYETLRRAHLSEHYHSAYSFALDLPDDIAAMSPERHYSDSDSYVDLSDSDSSGALHSPRAPSPHQAADVEPWLLASVEENQAHRELWQRLEQAADAPDLMALIGRLTQAAPYRTENTRIDFAERVWRVLEAADQNQERRLLYNGIAQEALVQPDTGFQTCHDGAWLVFNQIEIQMFIAQSVSDVPATLRGQTLLRLTRRLYRLHELDAVAREKAGGRDEAEVRLAYRLRWASELDLPLPPSNMLYQVHASIRPGELDAALARVQLGEYSEPFMRYAAQRDFWVQYLREVYAERFDALKQDYLARVVALPDRFPGRAIDELGEEYATLQRAFEAQELKLIRELTYIAEFEQG